MSLFDQSISDTDDSRTEDQIRLLGERFIARKDVFAIEAPDGAWSPVRRNLRMKEMRSHLDGRISLGHYVLNQEDQCKFFMFDIDLQSEGFYIDVHGTDSEEHPTADGEMIHGVPCNPREVWTAGPKHPGWHFMLRELRTLGESLAIVINNLLGIHVLIVNSGAKGLHIYGCTGLIGAAEARSMAMGIMNHLDVFEPSKGKNFFRHKYAYRNLEIEVFPKQDTLAGKDLGNLVRLPLGKNQKSGFRSHFVNTAQPLDKLVIMDPIRALEGDLPWE